MADVKNAGRKGYCLLFGFIGLLLLLILVVYVYNYNFRFIG